MLLPTIFRHIAAHWKIEIAIPSILLAIGLLANQATSPKVLAVMVFLSDWKMRFSWEWWTRTIIYFVIGVIVWWIQKKKYDRQLCAQEAVWQRRVNDLSSELKHAQLMLSAAQTRIDILSKRTG
jgi:hypothetical protein